jgi:hypothetical protein
LQARRCNRSAGSRICTHKTLHFHPKEKPVDAGILVPISIFACIAYSIQVCVDASVRRRMVEAGGSADLIDSVVRDEKQRRRLSSLRWGIVLMSVALGFGLIQWFGWREVTPGLIAVLSGATGLGNVVFFLVSRRLT